MSLGLILAAAMVMGTVAALAIWRGPVFAFAGRTVGYLREVRAELRKVSWPTLEDLRKSTMVIIVFVIAVGILIGIMDFVFSKVLIDVLGRAFA